MKELWSRLDLSLNRIDFYTTKLFWGYFIGALVIFVTIFVAIDAMSTMVNYKDVAGSALFRYYIYALPDFISKTLPVSCLLATVLTLSNLNNNNELVALYASGLSLLRISLPMLLSIFIISTVFYFIGDNVTPSMTRQKNYIFYTEIKKRPEMYSVVKTDRIWYRSKNSIFNLQTLSPEAKRAQGMTMYLFSENWDLLQMITAKDIVIKGSQWLLRDGSVTIFTADSSFPLTSGFKEKQITMSEDTEDLTSTAQTSDMLSQSELSRFIDKNKEAGLDTVRYEVDYHAKYAFSFAGIVMSLLGIPFSVGRNRSGGKFLNIGICLGLVFGYWVLYSSALTLGGHSYLPAFLAAWLPSLGMGGLAVYLLKKLKR
jgi:lipopolysaccharide export system permease protein